MESTHHLLSSRSVCNSTAEVPSSTLRTALKQSHLFPICEVSTYNDSRISLHRFCQIPGKCQCKGPLVSTSAARTSASSFLFAVKFSFYTDMIEYMELPNLVPRYSVSVIVSRFTTLTEDLLLCCYQVTDISCSRYGFTCAFPARKPCNFAPLVSRNSGLSGSEKKTQCFPGTSFLTGSSDDPRQELAPCVLEPFPPRDSL